MPLRIPKHRDTDIFDTLCVNMHFRNNFVYVVNDKPPITCKRCFDYEIEVVNLVHSIIYIDEARLINCNNIYNETKVQLGIL